ncbi:ABC transporter substrate-binding protein [Corynebacterium sp. MSK044]|uniref:ABC transporter substrate-binding protein n=1 Tax=Corynebacterium sp. MSK044 TaxID=3050195 RepID=UPI00254FC18A|nr:ABC transporter substrate-binding protein [Corynebacterium sp. MSK044]MDK8797792.1 ABC transporter substrate-binding protein [Corynebacterium sp. MSK044]
MSACDGAQEAVEQPIAKPAWLGGTVEITDNSGTKTVPFQPKRVVALDPGIAVLLEDLGVDADYGSTPAEVARLEPDLVVIGAKTSHSPADFGEVAVVDLAPRKEQPLDWEVVRQAQVLGKIFGKEEEAKQLDDDFSAALKRARNAAKKSWTAAAVQVVDGKILPLDKDGGKLFGPVMEMVGLEPVTLAEKPDVILVSEPSPLHTAESYQSTIRQLDKDPTMKNVPAVKKGNVYVAPYSTPPEGTLTAYTQMFNELANHWSAIY